MLNYLSEFPIPTGIIPARLKEMLEPIGLSPNFSVEVCCRYENDKYGSNRECLYMQMVLVPEGVHEPFPTTLWNDGLVTSGVRDVTNCGGLSAFEPSVASYDYIVASWGNSSFYAFQLAEKVWMALGLTPRCEGNEQQRIIYDDLCEPAFNVVEGEVSSTYFYEQSRNVSWKMNNSYLRRYLWMRGCQGVRTFFYETYLEDTDEVRTVMNGQSHVEINKRDSVAWYEIDIREDQGKFLLQTWASVLALKPELCPEQTAESLAWPGVEHPVSREIANRISEIVYFDDKLLEKYEQNYQFKCIPYQYYESWIHCPSYHGRWAFAGFRRVGRNLLKAEVKDIYKGVPDSQILHAHKYVMSIDEARGYDANEEHMPSKVKRFVDVFLCLGDMLSRLGSSVKIDCSGADIIQIDKYVLRDSGMSAYPIICKLAHVVPLEMTQQEFLARCKILHEIISRINEGFLNSLVQCAGCKPHSISKFRSLKLLQVVLNIVADLNRRGKEVSAFMSDDEPDNWKENNSKLAAIFINNDLRIVDAHMTNECLQKLQRLGFDTASVNSGYGKAMDFIMDSVIKSLEFLVSQIIILLKRKYRA